MYYDPKGPTARAWDERNKLLALPREHTPAERRRLKKLVAQLIEAGVLVISTEF